MSDSIKDKITHNIGLKILSIVIAIALWLLINARIDPVKVVTVKDVPVSLLNESEMLSAGKMIEIVSGDKIAVKVRARRSVAENLTAGNFKATADLINKNEFNAVPISVSLQDVKNEEVEIISISTENGTSMLHVSLEDTTSKSFAVAIITDGNVKDGYFIFNSSVSPNLVTVSGSAKQLEKVEKLAVIANVNEVSSQLNQSCNVIAYDKEGNIVDSANLQFSESKVRVEMEIEGTKEIEIRVNAAGTPMTGYFCQKVDYAPHYITVAGKRENLAKISSLDFNCGVTNADADIEAEFNPAAAIADICGDGVKVVNESQKISARAIIVPLEERKFEVSSEIIQLINLAEGLKGQLEQSTVEITVSGKSESFERFNAADLKLYIDCAEYTASGTFNRALVKAEPLDGMIIKETTAILTIQTDESREARNIDEQPSL